MAKEKNIQISESSTKGKAEGKVSSTQANTSVIRHPLAEMERAFDRFLGRSFPSLWHDRDIPALDTLFGERLFDLGNQRLPKIDVIDRDNEIVVRAEVPGVDKKDISISLTDNLLTIKGETKTEKKEEKGDYHRREISSSSFARVFTLPGSVDSGKADATLKDGVLEITLPKAETSRKRNIEVK